VNGEVKVLAPSEADRSEPIEATSTWENLKEAWKSTSVFESVHMGGNMRSSI